MHVYRVDITTNTIHTHVQDSELDNLKFECLFTILYRKYKWKYSEKFSQIFQNKINFKTSDFNSNQFCLTSLNSEYNIS